MAKPLQSPRSHRLRPVANARSGVPTVFVDGVIGASIGGTCTAVQFREQLAAVAGAPVINVEINSDGGEITEGMAMYSALRQFPGRKVGIVTGIAASMASILLQGCDERRVAKGAFVMIHEARGGARGTPQQMRDAADAVAKMAGVLLDIYEARTGLGRKALMALMAVDNYMTAEEAVAQGFADAVETFEARLPFEAVARLQRDASPGARSVVAQLARRGQLMQGDAKARAAQYLARARKGSR